MAEYIEREALKKVIGDLHFQNYGVALLAIMEIPTADVVEVVRCENCIHWGGTTFGFICRKFSGIETKIASGVRP